jgi:twitching motility protein PilT
MKVVEQLLAKLVELGGSDLHIVPGLPPGGRVHGELVPFPGYPKMNATQTKKHIYEILTEEQIHAFEHDERFRNELDFAYGLSGVGRFRCNIHRTRDAIALCARALASELPNLDKLNLHPTCKALCDEKRGLILVTGPTGSGKSTTLAAMIDRMNATRTDHILTIEDPIEYVHPSKKSYVTQREVGDQADSLSFKNALKFALRQDPDVILVGEMRDYETIGIAITAAETGHLVMGTLHTMSAAQTLGRIIDVFPVDQQPQVQTQLGSNLVAICSQVLIPKVDGKGRALAMEILINTPAVRNNVLQGKVEGLNQVMSTAQREGMQTMDQAIVGLAQQRLVSLMDVEPYVKGDHTMAQLKQMNLPQRRNEHKSVTNAHAITDDMLKQAQSGNIPGQSPGPMIQPGGGGGAAPAVGAGDIPLPDAPVGEPPPKRKPMGKVMPTMDD